MSQLVQYLPKKAYEHLQENPDSVLIDVRTEAENKFVGRPLDCIFVPWVDEPDWEPHPDDFIAAIKRFIGESALSTEIILICRSGYRSGQSPSRHCLAVQWQRNEPLPQERTAS